MPAFAQSLPMENAFPWKQRQWFGERFVTSTKLSSQNKFLTQEFLRKIYFMIDWYIPIWWMYVTFGERNKLSYSSFSCFYSFLVEWNVAKAFSVLAITRFAWQRQQQSETHLKGAVAPETFPTSTLHQRKGRVHPHHGTTCHPSCDQVMSGWAGGGALTTTTRTWHHKAVPTSSRSA